MKNFGFTINVDKGSNFVVGHSESEWSPMKDGAIINIQDSPIFYTIVGKEKIFFIQDFIYENNKLIINGDYENLLIVEDVIDISYKEYELLTVKNIINKGENYKIGDTLSILGGVLSISIIDNSSQSTLLKVEEINSNGGIEKISVLKKGIYLTAPILNNKINGGNGINAEFSLEYKLLENRKIVERQIENIYTEQHNTIIELNFPLPTGVKEGKVSVEKWKAFLNTTYNGENLRDADYHIIHDFTPNIKLPFVSKKSNKFEECYNQSMILLEAEITRLSNKIQELESRIK